MADCEPITLDRDTVLVAYQRDIVIRSPADLILIGIPTQSPKSVVLNVRGDNYIIRTHGLQDFPPLYEKNTYEEFLDEGSLSLTRGVGQSIAIYDYKENPHLNPARLLTIQVAQQEGGKTRLRFGLPVNYDVMRGELLERKGVFLIQLAHTLNLELARMQQLEAMVK